MWHWKVLSWKLKVWIYGKFMCNWGCWRRCMHDKFISSLQSLMYACVNLTTTSLGCHCINSRRKTLILRAFAFLFQFNSMRPKLGKDEHVSQMSSLFLVKLWFSFSHCLQLKFIYSIYLYALYSTDCTVQCYKYHDM